MTAQTRDDLRGARVERMTLAWNRAATAVSANGALLLRAGFVDQVVVVVEDVGFVVAFVGFAVWALSLIRDPTITGQAAPYQIGHKPVAAFPFGAIVLVLSLVDLAVVVFGR